MKARIAPLAAAAALIAAMLFLMWLAATADAQEKPGGAPPEAPKGLQDECMGLEAF